MSVKWPSSIYSAQKSARLENAARGSCEEHQNQNQTEDMDHNGVVAANDIKALKGQI